MSVIGKKNFLAMVGEAKQRCCMTRCFRCRQSLDWTLRNACVAVARRHVYCWNIWISTSELPPWLLQFSREFQWFQFSVDLFVFFELPWFGFVIFVIWFVFNFPFIFRDKSATGCGAGVFKNLRSFIIWFRLGIY